MLGYLLSPNAYIAAAKEHHERAFAGLVVSWALAFLILLRLATKARADGGRLVAKAQMGMSCYGIFEWYMADEPVKSVLLEFYVGVRMAYMMVSLAWFYWKMVRGEATTWAEGYRALDARVNLVGTYFARNLRYSYRMLYYVAAALWMCHALGLLFFWLWEGAQEQQDAQKQHGIEGPAIAPNEKATRMLGLPPKGITGKVMRKLGLAPVTNEKAAEVLGMRTPPMPRRRRRPSARTDHNEEEESTYDDESSH
ncbi:hypothetical protein BC832DRAFT_552136 [Gaertneriomyces semiglobifer]|nr:hypothetical protein BC832DRAFT_552136 [Gaertneriomyces semiglobifer]